MVFLNEEYLGDDEDLRKYLVTKYKFGITKNFQKQGEEQLIEIIKNDMNRNVSLPQLHVLLNTIRIIAEKVCLYDNRCG